MSQQSMAVTRETWDAWLRGDLDAVLATYAPDVVWDMTHFREWPDAVYVGHSGARDRREALEAVGLSEQDAHAES